MGEFLIKGSIRIAVFLQGNVPRSRLMESFPGPEQNSELWCFVI